MTEHICLTERELGHSMYFSFSFILFGLFLGEYSSVFFFLTLFPEIRSWLHEAICKQQIVCPKLYTNW